MSGVVEFIAYLSLRKIKIILELVVTKLPRRYGMMGASGIMAILGLLFLFPSIVKSKNTQLVVIGFDRFIGSKIFFI